MKVTFSDSFPLFILVLSLSMALFNPIIRENDVLRVGWAIIHTIIATSYLTGLIMLKAIRSFRLTPIEKEVKEQLTKAHKILKDAIKSPPGSGTWNRIKGYTEALELVLEKIQKEHE